MKRTYQVVTKPSTLSSRELAEFLSKDGQLLLPLVELLERGEKAIDEVIDVMGRATVEAVLRMSAEQLAGPKRQGRRADDRALYWHGSQPGRVTLSERRPRRRAGRAARGKAASAHEDGAAGGARRGRDPGVRRDAARSAPCRPHVGDHAERRLDPALRDGPAGDGRAGRHRQVGGLP